MTAAVARVPTATVPWGDDKIERPIAAAAKIYYPGQMVCRDTSGNIVDATDTAGLQFDGLCAESIRIQQFSGDAAGTRVMKIERPWRFAMTIASAVAGDEGKKLYISDNQTLTYSSVNSILVGFVDQVLPAGAAASTVVLVVPLYSPLNNVAVSGNVLAFAGATGVDQITFPAALADALTFAQGSNQYLTFVTTAGSELSILKGPAATASTNTGGGIQITAGIGGSASGAGGTVVIAGGAGTAGNAAGGLVSMTGGAGQGSAAGGAGSLVGGAGGATGAGGAVTITGGAGGATSGTGGSITITGGAGTGTNAIGGNAFLVGGAGNGTQVGGTAKVLGGAGGATAAGGPAQVIAGAGGGTSGTGGAVTITAGAALGTSAVGGAVNITAGASAGASGTAGQLSIDAGAATGGTGASVIISDVNAVATYLNRGPLKALQVGLNLVALGTVQSSTPTSAQLLGGFLTQTSVTGAGTVTLPTGTALSTACARTPVVGDSFDVMFANLGGGFTLTITGATGTTVVSGGAIASAKCGLLRFINTGSNAWSIAVLAA